MLGQGTKRELYVLQWRHCNSNSVSRTPDLHWANPEVESCSTPSGGRGWGRARRGQEDERDGLCWALVRRLVEIL